MPGHDATFSGLPFASTGSPSLQLSVQQGPDEGRVIHCRRVVTLIGSRPGCKIRLDHPLVSPVHVALINDGTDVHAVDLVTHHGTMLNDLKMEYERLRDGDGLSIDPWSFRVALRRSDGGGGANRAATVELEFAPNVIALEHLASGRVLRPNRDVCTVGRRSGCDIQVDDAGVSRAHALLFLLGDHPVVVDLLSRNGTLVNDERVTFCTLKDQDVLGIGEARFRVRILEPAVGAPKSLDTREVTPRSNRPVAPGRNGLPTSPPSEEDLIDIQAVEGSQRWRIADKLEQTPPKRRVAR